MSVILNPRASAGLCEHTAIDCVAIFYEEGQGGENYRRKNKFRCRVYKEEEKIVKFRESSFNLGNVCAGGRGTPI